MNVAIPDSLLDAIATAVADRVAARLPQLAPAGSPWMRIDQAVEYSGLGRSTFEKLSARGEIRSHSDRGPKLYHRDELDEDLGYVRPRESRLRSVG